MPDSINELLNCLNNVQKDNLFIALNDYKTDQLYTRYDNEYLSLEAEIKLNTLLQSILDSK